MRVELHDIKKYFGDVRANDGISLTFDEGRICGLLGENGAGKSTLMKILSGYQPQDGGTINLDGQQASFNSPSEALQHGIGMLYQDPHDFPPMRVIDNILLGRDNKLLPDQRSVRQQFVETAARFGFEVHPEAYVDSLSIGERQQLELVRLLSQGARVLILDEPTTGISAEQKEVLFGTIRRLAHEDGMVIVFVSHKLEEVQELCDSAAVLRKGVLVGTEQIPCPTERLVEMMFGELLRPPSRERVRTGDVVLAARDLSIWTYRVTVEGVDLDVHEGEVLGLAGLEGSGQALLLRACAGLIRPRSGILQLGGRDIIGMSYHQLAGMGVSFVAAGRLEEGLVGALSVAEHLVLTDEEPTFFIDWTRARRRCDERIAQYNIVGTPDSLTLELSGGNQQRTLFALLRDRLKVLLLEHPTRGLDVGSAAWIWGLLEKRRLDGTAIIFISADLDELFEHSDRIAVFHSGRMSRLLDARETSVEEIGYLIGGKER